MKKVLAILVAALLISCNSTNKNDNTQSAEDVALENIDVKGGELTDHVVRVTGMVSHVCKHGGQKMFLTNSSQDVNLLVRVSKSIPEFDIALEGSNVEVTGKLIATMVNEMESDHSEGEMQEANKAEGEPANCPTEEAMKAGAEGDECKTNVTYHVEATSFKELASR